MPEDNNNFKKLITTTILTSLLGTTGYLGKTFFLDPYTEEKKQQEEKQKELFEQNNNEFEKIYTIYNKTYIFYEKGFAFTHEELKPIVEEWIETKESYEKNLREIERFGNSDEIDAAKQTNYFITSIVSMLKTNLQASNLQEQTVAVFSKIDINDHNTFQTAEKLMITNLDFLINIENNVYYELRYDKNILEGLKKYSDYQYKNTLHIPEPQENIDTIKKSINLYKNRSKETIYENSKFAYLIAQKRENHNLKDALSENQYLQDNNEKIKMDVAKKFIVKYLPKFNDANSTQ